MKSMLCRAKHFEAGWYRHWADQIATGSPALDDFGPGFKANFAKVWESMQFEQDGSPLYRHRKMWEWCAIAETISKAGVLREGKRGCGFAVGREPLASLFGKMGAEILATDLASDVDHWATTGQQAAASSQIWWPGLIGEEEFKKRVAFQPLDMRDVSPLSRERFDFMWSSCSIEHLGSIEAGLRFVEESTKLLQPGGIAVHTTEFNLSSNFWTMETDWCVIFRKKDLADLDRRLRRIGARIRDFDLDPGQDFFDRDPDVPPYYTTGRQHVKMMLGKYKTTSIILIIDKNKLC